MIKRAFWVESDVWTEARERLGVFGNISDLIRKLLKAWLAGKINIDDLED